MFEFLYLLWAIYLLPVTLCWFFGKKLWAFFIKGQLISKANFLGLIWTKKRTKSFFEFWISQIKKIKKLYYINWWVFNTIWGILFFIWLILEARAELKIWFCSFFGSNENKKICFRNYLTFRKSLQCNVEICCYFLSFNNSIFG